MDCTELKGVRSNKQKNLNKIKTWIAKSGEMEGCFLNIICNRKSSSSPLVVLGIMPVTVLFILEHI